MGSITDEIRPMKYSESKTGACAVLILLNSLTSHSQKLHLCVLCQDLPPYRDLPSYRDLPPCCVKICLRIGICLRIVPRSASVLCQDLLPYCAKICLRIGICLRIVPRSASVLCQDLLPYFCQDLPHRPSLAGLEVSTVWKDLPPHCAKYGIAD